MRKILGIIALLLLPTLAFAQFNTIQGGTGTSSPSGIIYGDGTLHMKTVNIGSNLTFTGGTLSATGGDSSSFGTTSISALWPIAWNTATAVLSWLGLSTTSPWTNGNLAEVSGGNLTSVPTTTVTCSGSASCTTFTIPGASPITIIGSGGGGGGNVSTSTHEIANDLPIWTSTSGTNALLGQILAGTNGYTLAEVGGVPTWTATTTFNSPLNYSAGAVTLSTAGTWTGNAGTATALASVPTNCGAGFFTLGINTSGNSQNCTYVLATTSPWAANQFVYLNNSGVGVTAASSSFFGYTPLNPTRNINTTFPLQGGGNLTSDLTLSSAFGTTSTWGIANNQIIYTSNTGVPLGVASSSLFGATTNGYVWAFENGAWGAYATTTLNQTITLSGAVTGSGATAITTSFGNMNQGVLTNPASAAAIPTPQATSTLYGPVQNGQVLAGSNGILAYVATTTFNAPLTYSAGAVSCASCSTNAYPFSNLSNYAVNTAATTTAIWAKGSIFASSTVYGGAATTQWSIDTSGNVITPGAVSANNFNSTGSALPADGFTQSAANQLTLTTNTIPNLILTTASSTLLGNLFIIGSATTSSLYTSASTTVAGAFNATGNDTFGNATSTNFSTTIASTTDLFGAMLSSCNGASSALTWNAGTFGCNTISSAAFTYPFPNGATSTPLMLLASTTIGNGTVTGGLTVSGTASTTNLIVTSAESAGCAQFSAQGLISSTGTACGSGGGGTFAWTPTTNFGAVANSTSTPIWFQQGLQASSTSYLMDINTVGQYNFSTTSLTATSTLMTFNNRSLMIATTTPGANTGFGLDTLSQITNGLDNTAFGYQTMQGAKTTASSVGFGYEAGGSGSQDASFGYLADNHGSGTWDTSIGAYAGGYNGGTSATGNTAIGASADEFNTTGGYNSYVGYNAGYYNSAGINNNGMGYEALMAAGGNDNVGIGYLAGSGQGGSAKQYSDNIFIGYNSASTSIAGATYNVFVGSNSGYGLTTGYSNTMIGSYDLKTATTSGDLTSSNDITLGNDIFLPNFSTNNQLNIGNLIFGTLPGTTTQFQLPYTGKIGIASSSPAALVSLFNNASSTITDLFDIGSTTNTGGVFSTTTLFSISNIGAVLHNVGTNVTNAFTVNNASSTDVFNLDTTATLPAFQIGTSSPSGALPFSTPQSQISDIGLFGNVPYQDSFLLIASSSQTATSTLLNVANTGAVDIGSTTVQSLSAILTLGNNVGTSNGSSTVSTGKWQIDGYNAAGTRECTFLVGTTLTVIAGACNQ